jgi:hemolysin activation/secretion protein
VQKLSKILPAFFLIAISGIFRNNWIQPSFAAPLPIFQEPRKPFEFPKPLPPRESPLKNIPTAPQAPIQPGLPILKVRKFIYVGNTVFSNSQLDKITSPYLNKTLTPKDLQEIQKALTDFYNSQGYTNSGAYIDKTENQSFNLNKAEITIRIVEGGLESISIEGTNRLQSYIKRKLDVNISRPFNSKRLLNDLIILQEDPLLKGISASIDPPSDPTVVNTTALKIKAIPNNPYRVEAFTDNIGSISSGSLRQGIIFSAGNPLRLGDKIDLTYARTDGTNSLKVGYAIPTSKNTTLKLSYFFGENLITQSPFDILAIRGTSQSFDISLENALYQKATENTRTEFGIRAGFRYNRIEESLLGIPFQISEGSNADGITDTKLFYFDQYFSHRDRKQAVSLNSRFLGGVDLDSATDPLFKNGAFVGWRGELGYTRLLPLGLVANAKLQMQFVNSPVTSSDQFSLGGQNSVRGVAENLALGYNGVSGSLQLNKILFRGKDGSLGIFAFLDGGQVWNGLKRNSFSQGLMSVGGGIEATYKNLSANITYGHPLVGEAETQGNSLQGDGFTFIVRYRLY